MRLRRSASAKCWGSHLCVAVKSGCAGGQNIRHSLSKRRPGRFTSAGEMGMSFSSSALYHFKLQLLGDLSRDTLNCVSQRGPSSFHIYKGICARAFCIHSIIV